jgi:YVTN family beta-propeller protein
VRHFVTSIVFAAGCSVLSAQEPLTLSRTILLPQVQGRIDHLAYDPDSKRLFVAALGNNSVEVIDTTTGTRTQGLPGFHEPQGIAVAASARRIVIANGEGGDVQLRNGADLHVATTVPLGDDADNVRYDPAAKRIYVGYGGGAIAVVDPADGRKLGEVRVAGHPESFQLETSGPRIFVNVPTAHQVAVVDRNALKLIATWPLTEAASNFPMALDEPGHRLFVGCRRPAKVLIVDTGSGKVTGTVDVVGDTDDLFYDAARRRLYVTGGEGFVDVVQQQDGSRFSRVAHIPTAPGARTSLWVAEQNRLYVAAPRRGSQMAEIRIYEAR